MITKEGVVFEKGPEGSVSILRVPAKINLWLEVIGKRENGYHDISSLMLPISVFDRLTVAVRPGDGGIAITCDTPEIPADERNLAWRAADLYVKASGKKAGVDIGIEKRIPWGAGLGGGSSDAAGVLVALNSFFENAIPSGELETVALTLGADVPFFLASRPALATGVGEKLELAKSSPDYPLLLIKPPVFVATGWVYQSLKLTKQGAQIKLAGFEEKPYDFELLVDNDLESVTVPRYPVIAAIKQWLIGRGALTASMSGSGPTVFGIFPTDQAAAEAAQIARKEWSDCWVHAARVMGRKNRSRRRAR
ncbi:MAG: 4-(cytidine 5'-diphospho)-2-C-methyl-D-erythritol kinase [Syntrophobacteraceae bacterium]|nr:4-(cytidine 5'-diphospho)-2-C-methyl-D-erythritol kinase [Syntrophobacteraceae bacterium]